MDRFARHQSRAVPNNPSWSSPAARSKKSPSPACCINKPTCCLLDEPTRGIDVGTKAEIYRLIGELAAAGKSIIFVSSYLPELMATCDRLGVMNRGRLCEIRPAKNWTEESFLAMAVSEEEAA